MVYRDPPRFSIALITPPEEEPVTLEEAMVHLNIGLDDRTRDGWLARNIPTAREKCEGYLGRALAPQTVEISFGGHSQSTTVPTYWQPLSLNPWPDSGNVIELPMGPVVSVTSVTYLDSDGDSQVMDDESYVLSGDVLSLASGGAWPSIQASRSAIQIRYVTGYGLPDDSPPVNPIPSSLITAMLLALTFAEMGDVKAWDAAKLYMDDFRLRLGMA